MKNIQQRHNKIIQLHLSGKTQQDIADSIGLTRQRVQQIEKNLGLVRNKDSSIKVYTITCSYSGKKFQTRNKNQKFATREYFYLSRRKYRTPEELVLMKVRYTVILKANTNSYCTCHPGIGVGWNTDWFFQLPIFLTRWTNSKEPLPS
jgi:DNA-binding XRE family transcriptional regulator